MNCMRRLEDITSNDVVIELDEKHAVIQLDAHRPDPHRVGFVVCKDCWLVYMSVRLVDAPEDALECPECGATNSQPVRVEGVEL